MYKMKPGVDIEEVSRIQNMYNKWGDKFLHRVFTPGELIYCLGKASTPIHLAGRYAAKEAVIKIIKNDVSPPLKTIEIIRLENGGPCVVLHDEAEKMARELGIEKVEISISHTKNFAVAFAIAYIF